MDATRITKTAESLGTPANMAPEQAMHGDAGPASDMYSVGCVLYELLSGMVGNAISDRAVPAPIMAGFLLSGVLIVPGLIMWLRRPGSYCGATHPPD